MYSGIQEIERKNLANLFMPTIPTFAVRETSVSRTANVGTVGMNEFKLNKLQKYILKIVVQIRSD